MDSDDVILATIGERLKGAKKEIELGLDFQGALRATVDKLGADISEQKRDELTCAVAQGIKDFFAQHEDWENYSDLQRAGMMLQFFGKLVQIEGTILPERACADKVSKQQKLDAGRELVSKMNLKLAELENELAAGQPAPGTPPTAPPI